MSTRDDYIAQYLANVSYEQDLTGAMANLFIGACKALLLINPESSATSQGGPNRFETKYGVNLDKVEGLMNQAQRWLSVNVTQNANALAATAQVPRQFGLNRMRRDHLPETPPMYANDH